MIKIRLKCFVIYILILISYILAFFPNEMFRYYDEIMGILCIVYCAYNFLTKKTDKFISTLIVILMLMSIIALVSNFLFLLHYNVLNVVLDMYLFLKTFFVLIATYLFFSNIKDINYICNIIEITVKIITIILFVSLLISLIYDTDLAKYDIWGKFINLKVFVFYVKYPSTLAVYVGLLLAVLCANSKTGNGLYFIMASIVLFFTQAGLAYIFLFAICALLFFFKYNRSVKWYHILLLVIGGAAVGYNEIATYLVDSSAARATMFRYAFSSAIEFFPFGTGFSTYGGTVAAQEYAKLYYKYGFYKRWGMGPNENGFYLNDTYYPMIIAQFGLIGTVIYVVLFIYLFRRFNKVKDVNVKISLMMLLIIVLTSNLGQGSVMSSAGVLIMMEMALLYRKGTRTAESDVNVV